MFFKKKEVKDSEDFTMIAALLIHTAKIDENYTDQEEEIIKRTILEIGVDKLNIERVMEKAKIIEKNSNQILDYTKKVKKMRTFASIFDLTLFYFFLFLSFFLFFIFMFNLTLTVLWGVGE